MKINISATLHLISVFIALFCYIARRKYSLIIVRCKSFPRFCCPYGSLYNFSFRRSIVLNAVFPTRFFFSFFRLNILSHHLSRLRHRSLIVNMAVLMLRRSWNDLSTRMHPSFPTIFFIFIFLLSISNTV